MGFDALYMGAGVMDMGRCEHAVSFKQQAVSWLLPKERYGRACLWLFVAVLSIKESFWAIFSQMLAFNGSLMLQYSCNQSGLSLPAGIETPLLGGNLEHSEVSEAVLDFPPRIGIPPVPYKAASCSSMFAVVR